jgi:multimeric flavodoxin WrbA
MKVTAFVGSARKKHTYNATRRFLDNLRSYGGVETEIVFLSDYHLEICRGCKLCTDRGEEFCPLKDDRDLLLEKLFNSDGVVFATPNYSFNVSGQMKVFLDRLAFALHRPRGFGKAFTSIVIEAIYRGKEIVKYLDFVGNGLLFNVVRGRVVKSLEPMTEKVQKKNERTIDAQSRKFYKTLAGKKLPVPSLFALFIFHWGRTSMREILDESYRDYAYYKKAGWFESDYFYPTRLGPVKKGVARLVDAVVTRRAKNKKITQEENGAGS